MNFKEKLRLRILEKLIRLFWQCDAYLSAAPSLRTKGIRFFTGLEPLVLSLIVSGIAFGANLAVQLLLSPKPKIAPKQKLNGEISLSDSAWGLPLYRIYGQRGADGIGGFEVGTNIIFCSDIRKIEVPVPGTTSSGGKGGGNSKASTNQTQEKLQCDMGAAIGMGRLRLLRLKLNEDIEFDQTNTVNTIPTGTIYEAESGTMSGTASIASITGFSNAQGVTNLNSNGTLLFSLTGTGEDTPLHIGYRSATDVTCDIEFGGETITYSFPATGNLRGWRTIYKNLQSGANSFKLQNASSADLKVDCIVVQPPFVISDPGDLYYRPTGIYDENFGELPARNNSIFPVYDSRGLENINRYNLPVYEQNVGAGIGDVNGVITATLASGAKMTFYPGSEDQPVDPVYAAWVASQPGKTAEYAQAFHGTSWVCIQDLDFTKWGSFPNIRALVENMDTGTVEEILLAEALLVPGLTVDDFDFSAASSKLCRGYLVSNNDPPEKTFNEMGIVHNLGFTETNDGKMTAIDKNVRVSVATITKDDLGAFVLDESQNPPQDDIVTTVPDEVGMPQTLEISFFNPLPPMNYGTDRREHAFPFTHSVKKDTVSVNSVLLPEESQLVVKRLNQEKWLKANPENFTLPQKYGWLDAGQCVSVEINGEFKLLRIERKEGAVPGTFEVVASHDELFVSADGSTITTSMPKETVKIPAATIGTLMELPPLFNEQTPGLYAAGCPIGPGTWSGHVLFRNKGAGYQQLATFKKKALMGRCVNALGDAPGGYNPGDIDSTNTLIVDFYNDFTPDTVTVPEQNDGANMFVAGDEIIYVRTWTRDNGFPNRWNGTNLIRRGKGTPSDAHAVGERCVFFSDAVKFIPLEPEERGITRNWKFVTEGEAIDAAAPISFTWNGGTPPPAPAGVAFDPQVETLHDLTVINTVYGLITFNPSNYQQKGKVYWKKPGREYELLTEVTPDGSLTAEFRAANLTTGTHYFKVVVVTSAGVEQLATPTEYNINVSATNFVINGKVIENVADRVFIGFDNTGKYTGRDTGVVPAANINAAVTLTTIKDGSYSVDFELQGIITDRALASSNADSLEESEVTVYDKFGNIHKKIDGSDAVFHADYKGAGTLASGDFLLKYAHPREEAYYKIRVRNSKGWSGFTYLYSDGTISTTPPTPKVLANCPQNLSASTLSSSSIRFNATFTFGANTLILQKREIGQAFADWSNHATGITSLPFDATGLAADHEHEFRLVSSAGTNNSSNLIRKKTFQTGQTAPARPAPSGLTVIPDPADPDNNLKVDWVRNATDNTSVNFEVNGSVTSLSASDIQEYLNGLGPLSSRTVRVQNVWSSGITESEWTAAVTGTTEATPSALPPQNFAANYDAANQEIDLSWIHGDGSGAYILEISNTGANLQAASGTSGWTNISSSISSALQAFSTAFAQTSTEQIRYLRLKRADVAGWVGSGQLIIPAVDPAQSPINLVVIQFLDGDPFDISWTDRGAAGDNVLEYSDDNSSWNVVYSSASNPTTHEPPLPGFYWYRVSNTAVPGEYANSVRVRWYA